MITDGIARVTRDGIVTADGTERAVDAIVLATGFHVTDWYNYLDIKGAHGEDLVDRWHREGDGGASRNHRCRCAEPVLLSGPTPAWDTTRWCS